jgi:type IV pilus assembly protein PilE
MRTRLEQYFLDNRAYPTGCVASTTVPAGAGNINLPASAKFFTTECTLAPTAYTITARGFGSMLNFIYTIDQANTRATTSTGSWGKSSASCWVSRKSGEC